MEMGNSLRTDLQQKNRLIDDFTSVGFSAHALHAGLVGLGTHTFLVDIKAFAFAFATAHEAWTVALFTAHSPCLLFSSTTLIVGDSIIGNLIFFNATMHCYPWATQCFKPQTELISVQLLRLFLSCRNCSSYGLQ